MVVKKERALVPCIRENITAAIKIFEGKTAAQHCTCISCTYLSKELGCLASSFSTQTAAENEEIHLVPAYLDLEPNNKVST